MGAGRLRAARFAFRIGYHPAVPSAGPATIALAALAACSALPEAREPGDPIAAHADDPEDPARLARALLALGPAPRIEHVRELPLRFALPDGTEPEHLLHPQGLAWIGSTRQWAISAVEVVEHRGHIPGLSPPNGRGRGYLFRADALGRIDGARTLELARIDDESFHPGGIDTSDGAIVGSLSPYYPRSRARVIRVDPIDGRVTSLFDAADHIGVVTAGSDALFAASWDARTWYAFARDGGAVLWSAPAATTLAVQDGQALGPTYLVWTGLEIGGARFGLDLLRVRGSTLEVVRSIRWPSGPHLTPGKHPPFQNAVHLWADRAGRIWAVAVPDDQVGRYAPRPHGSPRDAVDTIDPAHGQARSAMHLYRIH